LSLHDALPILHRPHARLRGAQPAGGEEAGPRSQRGGGLMFEHNETLAQARERNIRDALREDIGQRDWTAELVPAAQQVKARVLVREDAVLCGREWFDGCLHALAPEARVTWHYDEGARTEEDTPVCHIEAPARALLSAERPALNFLQLLSATA